MHGYKMALESVSVLLDRSANLLAELSVADTTE